MRKINKDTHLQLCTIFINTFYIFYENTILFHYKEYIIKIQT